MSSPTGIAEMARDLADGRTDSMSLTRQALARIAETNPDWHIFISVSQEAALASASASDRRRKDGNILGPLDGIPVAIKDNIDIAGMATTEGTDFYKTIRTDDAFVVERLRAAGAILLGKLNMHECALGATTDNPFWGRCANPSFPGATPGGSSGGSAAAVAGALAAFSLGTDTMGSVRIPAAYCGVWGVKPTRGLISTRGLSMLSWTLDTIGVIAANATDLATGLAAIAGFDPADPYSRHKPGADSAVRSDNSLKSMVLGRPLELDKVACDPDIIESYERLLVKAEREGAIIKPVSIAGWEPTVARRAGLLVCEAEVAERIGADIDRPGEGFSDGFRALVNYGRHAPGVRLASAYRHLEQIRLETLKVLDSVDVLILPTAPQRAFPHATPAPANQADLTALANIAFCPAVAFPQASQDGGAPVSCQLIGQPFSETRLIAIARLLADLDPVANNGA